MLESTQKVINLLLTSTSASDFIYNVLRNYDGYRYENNELLTNLVDDKFNDILNLINAAQAFPDCVNSEWVEIYNCVTDYYDCIKDLEIDVDISMSFWRSKINSIEQGIYRLYPDKDVSLLRLNEHITLSAKPCSYSDSVGISVSIVTDEVERPAIFVGLNAPDSSNIEVHVMNKNIKIVTNNEA